MNDKLKNAFIGLFVLGAFGTIAFMLLFLHPTVGNDAKKYRIRFADIDKVNMGTRVNYAGKAVGEVSSIKEVEDPKNPRQAINGFIYLYEVDIVVDSSVEIFNSDEVSLRTAGLLGEKSVAITPRSPKPGEPLRLISQDELIFAHETSTVEETLKEFKELSDKVEEALDSFLSIVRRIEKEEIIENIGKTAKHAASIAESLDDGEKWKSLFAQGESVMKNADSTFKNANTLVENANALVGNTLNGEGTLGKFFTNDELYLRTNSILSKVEVLADDINHYGLLFHSDKGWQRMRARRANLLAKLECPSEFRNYFNDEMDAIMTSLARVNCVVEKTACLPYFSEVECDQDFRKVFAELLRRVKMMEESLELYNQGLMQTETFKTELIECREVN